MQRSTSVTVFGILNFVFAIFGIIGLMASFALFSVPADPDNPVVKLLHQNATYTFWLKFCVLLGLLNCAALLVAGIGLIGLKPWGRTLSMVYAIYALAFAVMGMGINLFFMIQPLFDQAPPHQEFAVAAAIGGPLSGTIGGCFGLIYPVVLLAFVVRPKVAGAFRPPAPVQT